VRVSSMMLFKLMLIVLLLLIGTHELMHANAYFFVPAYQPQKVSSSRRILAVSSSNFVARQRGRNGSMMRNRARIEGRHRPTSLFAFLSGVFRKTDSETIKIDQHAEQAMRKITSATEFMDFISSSEEDELIVIKFHVSLALSLATIFFVFLCSPPASSLASHLPSLGCFISSVLRRTGAKLVKHLVLSSRSSHGIALTMGAMSI
jgi:hypothetical protein